MWFKFLAQPVSNGRYEPEGIYLSLPLEGECRIMQSWGEHSEFYQQFCYNGVPLKGHNGVDFWAKPNIAILAVDDGRVVELGYERQGFERYVKLEHSWGESLYANVGEMLIDSGQIVRRNEPLAQTNHLSSDLANLYLHFGIRVRPFHRFDGWGGFCDPLPFLDPTHLRFVDLDAPLEIGRPESTSTPLAPHPMLRETTNVRRP